MLPTPQSEYLVPFDGSFRVADARTTPPADAPGEEALEKKLGNTLKDIDDLQRALYAQDRWSLLLVFQAMDAAGKDSTIRALTSNLNAAGFQVHSFKQPSQEELDHDFLWRAAIDLPERGRIGVFNRSHYEEVLVVRVHPEFLENQRLPHRPARLEDLWDERYESIRGFERHLSRSGTAVLKFWLNVSRDEQRRRFLDRIDEPDKNWKFSARDLDERARWDDYMAAYEAALNATSRPCAPWYAIPADDKPWMRLTVARLVREALRGMELEFPVLSAEDHARMLELREQLLEE